jgi:hypothetical protein
MMLDPRTIMFVTACMGPVLAMVLLSLRRNYPSSIRGLGWWAQGTWWVFFGVILVTLRDWIPAGLSIVAGNALIIIGTWHWLVGTNKFLGLNAHRRAWLIIVGISIVAIAWFYFLATQLRYAIGHHLRGYGGPVACARQQFAASKALHLRKPVSEFCADGLGRRLAAALVRRPEWPDQSRPV